MLLRGRDIGALAEREMRDVRGKQIAMIFQEPMTSLNPVLHGRRPDRASRCASHHGHRPRGKRSGAAIELLETGRHSRRRSRRVRELSAPAVRRHAPARHDRDGAGVRPGAAHRRRADDGARRHDPGADPRAAAPDCSSELGIGGHAHHPRPRRRRRDRRPRGRDVCRADRRERRRSTSCSRDPQHPYTRGLLASHAAARRPAASGFETIPGTVPNPRPADRLPRSTRAALRQTDAVRPGCPGLTADRRGEPPAGRLLSIRSRRLAGAEPDDR